MLRHYRSVRPEFQTGAPLHSRGADTSGLCILVVPPETGGRREHRALNRTRNPRGLKRKVPTSRQAGPKSHGHSLRNGVTVAPRSPQSPGLLASVALSIFIDKACPQRRGDRTTRLGRTRRIGIAYISFASIAPRTTSRGVRETPSVASAGCGECRCVSFFRKEIYFCGEGLTRFW
jgi:hypothetical protein